MASVVRNIVNGMCAARRIVTIAGSFSQPSSTVMNATFCLPTSTRFTCPAGPVVAIVSTRVGAGAGSKCGSSSTYQATVPFFGGGPVLVGIGVGVLVAADAATADGCGGAANGRSAAGGVVHPAIRK